MYPSSERLLKNIEFQSAVAVGTFEMAKIGAQIWGLQALSIGTEFDAIPMAVNFVLDYTGDFSAGYLGTWFANSIGQKYSDRKLNIASTLAMGACVLAETVPTAISHGILGTPRIEDLGAAAVGILAYRTLNKYIRRNLSQDS